MKTISTLIIIILGFQLFAQENDSITTITEDPVDQAISEAMGEDENETEYEDLDEIELSDDTRITVGENELLIVEENGDTTKVFLGNRGLKIVEGKHGTEVVIMDMDQARSTKRKHTKRFKPHWAGLEVGLNNYLTPDRSMTMPPGQEYMDLNTGRSWNWNLNMVDFGIGLGTSYVGLASGIGLEFINYEFDGQNGIQKDPVNNATTAYYPSYADNITKSKFNMTYIYAPLLLEFQIPAGHQRIYVSGGVLGGVKLCSKTKIKYRVSGDKAKEKVKGDYNLAPLRWGLTARVGYRGFGFFANYYPTPLFKEAGGPELYPFSVGLTFGGW